MAATSDDSKNICAVLKAKGDLQLEERPIPKPGRGEVLLRMRSVGICGSDVHYWVEGRIGDFIVRDPMVMGHESSGVVMETGEGVTDLKPGDRVAIEPGVPCRTCSFCKAGRYNLCPDMRFCATPPIDGSLANYYVHASDFCYKLPDHVSFDEGALLEPLSVGVHACNRAGVSLGSKVLICGAGPIGLVCLLTAKACGASETIITDLDAGRLEMAKKLGATHTVKVTTRDSNELAKLIETTLGCKPDQTIECSGAQPSIATAIYATRSGGTLVLVGLGAPEVKLPIVDACIREVDIRGIFRYCNCYPTALEMVSSGKVDVKPLITHYYKLDQTLDAFERAKTGAGGAIKVMIQC
jgi:L-iditol 2-dehydrogenase